MTFQREESNYIDPSKPAYDVLLDHYERGLSSKRIDEVFTQGNLEIFCES
jgi:carboxypeptidase Taq